MNGLMNRAAFIQYRYICNISHVFTVKFYQLNESLLIKSMNFLKSYWPQMFEW